MGSKRDLVPYHRLLNNSKDAKKRKGGISKEAWEGISKKDKKREAIN